MEYVLAVALFAISASITQDSNILVMTSGVNFGVTLALSSLPLLTGICVGFAVMLLLVGTDFSMYLAIPSLHFVIKCLGVLYLLYLAFVIAFHPLPLREEQHRPLSFINGALFQWVNGKAWVVASGTIAAFTSVGGNLVATILLSS